MKKINVFFSLVLLVGTFFILSTKNSKAAALNDCGTPAFNPTWKCTDVNGSNNIYNPSKACVTGHCAGASNIQCCRQDCDSGESCQEPTAGLTCEARGVCSGTRQCCKNSNGSATANAAAASSAVPTDSNGCPVCTEGNTRFCNPLRFCSVESFLTNVLTTLRQIIVVLSLVFVVIGAVMYIVSAGNSKMIENAKSTISSALIGLALGVAAPSFLKEIGNVLGWSGTTNSEVAQAPTLSGIAMSVLTFLLSILGVLALVMMIIGSIMYLTSAGDEDRIDLGKKIFKYSALGILIAMGSLVLVKQIALFFV